MKARSFWLSFAAVLVVCVHILCACKSGEPLSLEPYDMAPSWAPQDGRIVFVCYRRQSVRTQWGYRYMGPYDGVEGYKLKEICVSNVDGSSRRQLTDNLEMDYDPSWSPDGTLIAFVSSRDSPGGANIYTMHADGTRQIGLTHSGAGDRSPRWSPDGKMIAFIRGNAGGDVYLIFMDGGQAIQLTEVGDVMSFDWSPDERRIVFHRGVASDREIFIVDVASGLITQLTNNQVPDFGPVWSPDGQYIAFGSQRESGVQVYVMDLHTRDEIRISEGAGPNWGASWSPDGRFLAYINGNPGDPDQIVRVLEVRTEIVRDFPDTQALNGVFWSPDSEYLVYERLEDWNGDGFEESKIWVLRVRDGARWAVSSMD